MGRINDSSNFFWTIITLLAGLIFLIQSEYSYILLIAIAIFLLYQFSKLVSPKPESPRSDLSLEDIHKSQTIVVQEPMPAKNPQYSDTNLIINNNEDLDLFLNYSLHSKVQRLTFRSYIIDQNRIEILNKKYPIIADFHFINCNFSQFQQLTKLENCASVEFTNCGIRKIDSDLVSLFRSNNFFALAIEQNGEIANLQILSTIPNITSLCLRLGFEKVPEFIFISYNLRTLDLGHNTISSLHADIGYLINLEMLVVNNNLLTGLPKEIGNLKRLKSLYIHDNAITDLPNELTKLRLEELMLDSDNLLAERKDYFKDYFESINLI